MTEKRSDKWVSLTLSVLVHGAIAALLVWGYLFYRNEVKKPDVQLAIEATVVDARTIPSDVLKPTPPTTREVRPPAPEPEVRPEPEVKPEPQPEPPPPQPEPPKPEPPKPPPPDDSARREQERKAEERRVEVERERVEKERVEKERVEKERQEKERVAREQAAREKADRDKAEKERLEKEKADQLAKQRAADERLRTQRESELRAQLAAEERASAVRSSAAAQQYLAQIRARVERAWNRPASARPGLACQVRITQTQSGEVVKAEVLSCNGDQTVRESIETAVYNASPLPVAPDPALFERNLVLNFRPEE